MVDEKVWYAVHTYSGFENKVKLTIEHKAAVEGWRDQVTRVVIPQEPIIEIKGGKKKQVMRNLMPGYVLVEMESSEELFNLIREVKGVSNFVGDGHKPAPLSQSEVDNILDRVEQTADKPKPDINYSRGDQVKVTEGPFANFVGSIEHIDFEKHKLQVMVSIFGRPTPVELDVLQVEPAS